MTKKEMQAHIDALEADNKLWRAKIIDFAKIAIDELSCKECRNKRVAAKRQIHRERINDGELTHCCVAEMYYIPSLGNYYCR